MSNGETKADLRGHEHVVECAVFAPVSSYPMIRELAGLTVSLPASNCISYWAVTHYLPERGPGYAAKIARGVRRYRLERQDDTFMGCTDWSMPAKFCEPQLSSLQHGTC